MIIDLAHNSKLLYVIWTFFVEGNHTPDSICITGFTLSLPVLELQMSRVEQAEK